MARSVEGESDAAFHAPDGGALMSGSSVALIARLTAVAGQERVVAELLRQYSVEVGQEGGNLVFAANTVKNQTASFVIYEEYRDDTAFALHLASPHNTRFNRELASLVVGGRSELTMLEPLQGRDDETQP